MSSRSQLVRSGVDPEGHRSLFVISGSTFSELASASIVTGSRYFAALIVGDATSVSVQEIGQLARSLLDAGCVYFCCWGPDCERVHDVIDEEYASDGITVHDDESTIMTTWHNGDSLEEAVWFALNSAFPDDRFFEECRAVVAICIGDESMTARMTAAFAYPTALVARDS